MIEFVDKNGHHHIVDKMKFEETSHGVIRCKLYGQQAELLSKGQGFTNSTALLNALDDAHFTNK